MQILARHRRTALASAVRGQSYFGFAGVARTDELWRDASVGYMRMEKITYRSRAGVNITFVFQPSRSYTGRRPARLEY